MARSIIATYTAVIIDDGIRDIPLNHTHGT
jgi:hypothetical protein